jgi:signal transduction histidine kinase
MARLDQRGAALYMNRACRDLLASIGKPAEAFPDILPKRYRSVIRRVLTEKHSEDLMSLHEGRALRMTFKPSDDATVYLFIIDFTDQEEVKEQLLQSEKMASLGLLIAGLAHEINTPLGAIHSNNDTMSKSVLRIRELLKKNRGKDTEAAEQGISRVLDILDELCRNTAIASDRLIGISSSLREFTRRDEAVAHKFDIHEGLDRTLMIVQHKLKDRIHVEKHYGNVPKVECHPNRINQVFMNLLVNAAQAIRERGTIIITTDRKDDYARISITDDGIGIPDENIPRIFDPGFTTKGVGIGTGLGLSICYKILQEHRGKIHVHNESRGTTFTVELPLKRSHKVIHE